MTIDAEKLADIAIDAAFDDYEGSGIFTKDRAKEAAKKALTAHLKPKVPGGYGIGAYMPAGDGLHVYRLHPVLLNRSVDPPLLPDVD